MCQDSDTYGGRSKLPGGKEKRRKTSYQSFVPYLLHGRVESSKSLIRENNLKITKFRTGNVCTVLVSYGTVGKTDFKSSLGQSGATQFGSHIHANRGMFCRRMLTCLLCCHRLLSFCSHAQVGTALVGVQGKTQTAKLLSGRGGNDLSVTRTFLVTAIDKIKSPIPTACVLYIILRT